METLEYWEECLSNAVDECNLVITPEQLKCLAKAAESSHEFYGMAFYSPPSGDRMAVVEREWKEKYKELECKLAKYTENAETAVKMALHQFEDAHVSIGEYGEVVRYDGRFTRIQ